MKSRWFTAALLSLALVATIWFYFRDLAPAAPSILIPIASTEPEEASSPPSLLVPVDASEASVSGVAIEPERKRVDVPSKDGAGFRGARTPAQIMIKRDAYDELPLIDAVQEAPDSKGVFKRSRLVQDRSKKYQHILVEELWQAEGDASKLKNRLSMVGDHLIVQLKDQVSLQEFESAIDKLGARIRKAMSTKGLYLVEFEATDVGSLKRMMDALRQSPLVKFPEPDYVVGL